MKIKIKELLIAFSIMFFVSSVNTMGHDSGDGAKENAIEFSLENHQSHAIIANAAENIVNTTNTTTYSSRDNTEESKECMIELTLENHQNHIIIANALRSIIRSAKSDLPSLSNENAEETIHRITNVICSSTGNTEEVIDTTKQIDEILLPRTDTAGFNGRLKNGCLSHAKSMLKAVSYRIIGTTQTVFVAYLFGNDITTALQIGGVDSAVKILLFYIHDRLWQIKCTCCSLIKKC